MACGNDKLYGTDKRGVVGKFCTQWQSVLKDIR